MKDDAGMEHTNTRGRGFGVSGHCAPKSKSSEDGWEEYSDTESPTESELITDIRHKGSRRLVQCSVFPKGHKRGGTKGQHRGRGSSSVCWRCQFASQRGLPEARDIQL